MPDSKHILTPEEYCKTYGNHCPVCGSENMNAGGIDGDSDAAWAEVICENCGSEWTDQYGLNGYSNLTVGRSAIDTVCEECGCFFTEHDEEGNCPEEHSHA